MQKADDRSGQVNEGARGIRLLLHSCFLVPKFQMFSVAGKFEKFVGHP